LVVLSFAETMTKTIPTIAAIATDRQPIAPIMIMIAPTLILLSYNSKLLAVQWWRKLPEGFGSQPCWQEL